MTGIDSAIRGGWILAAIFDATGSLMLAATCAGRGEPGQADHQLRPDSKPVVGGT